MAPLSLKIILDNGAVTRKVKFDTHTTVRDAHEIVREKVHVPDKGKEYALFLRSADDDKSGVWLEAHRPLDYYMLRDGDSLDYICKSRNLRVKMLDGSVKTLQVDESKPVGELMMTICARIGITNYDEYGLCHDAIEEGEEAKTGKDAPTTGTLTLKRKAQERERDHALEQLSKKLKTDDNVEWLDQHRTLRELGVKDAETVLLKRRLYYSDRNVDSRDPVQLNLLYVQTRDAILNGRHPITEEEAVVFAGIQCQIHFGDFQEDKHKPGFIENLQEYLPVQYSSAWGIEKKFLKAYRQHQGLSPLDAKVLYIKTARDLPTYGVTFFLVKERQKEKKKLVPRLLGINAQSILRLDEVTKEILQQWPLTHVKSYHVGKKETFQLDFGDYSDKEYCVKTQDAHRIRDILEGYIDLIRKRMLAKHNVIGNESMVIGQDTVEASKGNIMQNVSHNATKVVTESFVGPSKIIQYDQGAQAQQGTQIVTVQQLIVTDQAKNKQEVMKGEVPLRGDMSMDCVRKLNRMNSNSVKIVTLLTDPTDVDVKDAQRIVENMQADLPIVNKGIQATSERQSSVEAQKMLLEEMQELNNYMDKLADSIRLGHVNAEEAKEAAENIAGLSAQIYFSVDPRTRRRSEILNNSRKSFIACEKTDATIRRGSFIAAAATALQAVDSAALAVREEYRGPHLDDEQRENLERSMEDKIGRLNAALALYLTAHADPKNVDYPAAINSMNTINELMPELARDAQILGSGRNPQERKELDDDMQLLFEKTRNVCALTGGEDHEKMQEATNQYADIAGKLIFTFGRGSNADKENEIIDLAKDVGDKTALLLMAANELGGLAAAEPAAQELDDAGVRAAHAARDLLATAQLTAPAIHEPHCRSALSAAAEGLAGAVQHLATACKPLLEDPARAPWEHQLHAKSMDVAKALDRLKDAYANMRGVGASDVEMADDTPQERQRLKFISSTSGARNNLQGIEDLWGQAKSPPTDANRMEAQARLAQMLAQLNAAVAALAAAAADRENPDYATAELATSTIAELMPQIVKDTEAASSGQDEGTRKGMQQHVTALCEASRAICAGAGRPEDLNEAASKFSAASGKLVFLVSPTADKGKEKQIIELSTMACGNASDMLGHVRRLAEELGSGGAGAAGAAGAAGVLDRRAAHSANCAQALLTAAQVTAPSIAEARCQNALITAVEQLRNSAGSLSTACSPHLQQQQEYLQNLQRDLDGSHRGLERCLDMLAAACQPTHGISPDGDVPQQERQRLKFISSVSGAKNCLRAAEDQLGEPMICALMTEGDAATVHDRLAKRLAGLNAAVAALNVALADRENPDYAAANDAISTITDLMPLVVEDSKTVGTFTDDASQAALLKQVRELCAANRALCEGVASEEALSDALDKYVAASSKLKFFISPADDNQKKNQVLDLSALACGRASAMLSHVHQLTEQIGGDAAAQLDQSGARAADAAQALITTAQVTAPSIIEPSCQRALISAAERLGSSADQLAAACEPHLEHDQPLQANLQDSHRQLQESLRVLTDACQPGACEDPALREKRRLKFISSVSSANNRLQSAQQQLQQPPVHSVPSSADAAAARSRLAQQLARLNAAVAALAAAVADRENPDYGLAERAVSTIAELMPQVVEDSQIVGANKGGAELKDLMQQVQVVCDAGQEICAGADNPETLSNAAAKYSVAAGKIKSLVDPTVDPQKQNQILDLSGLVCGRASSMLSHVHRLTEQLGGDAAAQLDQGGARTADAAQALLTTAQVTAPSIAEPSCHRALVSAAERLGSSADQLATACDPHLQQGQPLQADLQDSHLQLQESLRMLTDACQPGEGVDPALNEKRRLKFISSISGANNRLQAARQQLRKPPGHSVPSGAAAAAAQSRLAQQLARLNAAVAALAAAVADRENPDYGSAERAVSTIAELMPQVVEDSQIVAANKGGAELKDLMQQVQVVCDAGQEICAGADNPETLSNATAKYSVAAGKIKSLVDPTVDPQKQNQILDLSGLVCGRASSMLSHVHRLTEQLGGDTAVQLDQSGARTADAAQALLTAAQVTAPSIAEPSCQRALVSAAERLGSSADQLATACDPHLQQGQPLQADLQDSHLQLQESLRMLTDACQSGVGVDPALKERRRLKFISSISGANNKLQAAQQQLRNPPGHSVPSGAAAAAAQSRLAQQLARLNAAVAALAAAVADRENPDYASAERAVSTIAELMPQVVEDSQIVGANKGGAELKDLMQQVQVVCDAGQEICAGAENPETLSNAAAKYSVAASKIKNLVDPTVDPQKQNQILDLAALACGRASSMLSHVHRLAEQLGGDAAEQLDQSGAHTADATQALLTAAQVTAPSITEPSCQRALVSAAERLGSSADQLATTCNPHLQQGQPLQADLQDSHRQLQESLRMLTDACRCDDDVFPQEEKRRLKFISSVSVANNRLKAAEEQLKKPLACSLMSEEDAAALRRRLADRLALLNACVASLQAAVSDREKPDLVAADKAVHTIAELMPQVVQESRAVCSSQDDASQAAMLEHVKAMCDAGRAICAGAGESQDLNEATSKFSDASGKLVFLVSSGQPDGKARGAAQKAVPGKKPPVPVRGVAQAAPAQAANFTKEFLDKLRSEESQDHIQTVVAKKTVCPQATKTDDEKISYQDLESAMKDADKTLSSAEEHLKTLHKAGATLIAGPGEFCEKIAQTEDLMEETLAQAGVEVAALVSANYADKMDYKAALQPATNLPKLVNRIVEDASVVSGSLDDRARKAFLDNMIGVCAATRKLCHATRSDKEKLNDAAIEFGDMSAKLLHVVSSDANPALEKKLISRAKEIGDAASRLAVEAGAVAEVGTGKGGVGVTGSPAADICAAGASTVDAAGKLLYTAKCVAPSIYHSTCQDTLVASADNLSAKLAAFSKTWEPILELASVKKLIKESNNLETLVENLRRDVRAGMLGRKWEEKTAVVLDTPLKQMTLRIIDDAMKMSVRPELSPEQRQEYTQYARALTDALRALDIANSRCQRAPHDRLKHHQLENAVQDLQMIVLQTRPKRSGVELTNVVDLRDFLQEIANGADQLGDAATRYQIASSKKPTEEIKTLCATMKGDAEKLMAPEDNRLGDDTTLDHILDIDMFGQECEELIKGIKMATESIQDARTVSLLQIKLAPLVESCNLLRFATRTALSTAQGAAFDAAMNELEEFESQLLKPLVEVRTEEVVTQRHAPPAQTRPATHGARWALQAAGGAAAAGDPRHLHRALTDYAVTSALDRDVHADSWYQNMCAMTITMKRVVGTGSACVATCRSHDPRQLETLTRKLAQDLEESPQASAKRVKREAQIQVLNEDDIQKLLLPTEELTVTGTKQQLEEKLQQLATKVGSISGTIILSVRKPESLARSLHATADAALQLADTARALKDNKQPSAGQKIEESAREMCLATYHLLKTSELASHDPDHPNTKRKLLEACRLLNDTINKLVRSAGRRGGRGGRGGVGEECGALARGVQLRQAALQAGARPASALPYADCLDTLREQQDVIHKLDSDVQAMSREEFMKSLNYITSAINNSTESAAHCAYLLSVSETDESIGKEGLVDVPKLHKMVAAVQDSCVSIIRSMDEDEVKEEKKVLEKQVEELLEALDAATEKTKSAELKTMLKSCRVQLNESAKELCKTIDLNSPRSVRIAQSMRVLGELQASGAVLERAEPPPSAATKPDTRDMCEEIMENSRTLLTKTQDLIREVKSSPEEPEVMKWVMFTKRKNVIDAFEALLKSIKTNGQRVKLIETTSEETDGSEQKSYIQTQVELAKRWLMKPIVKAEVKVAGKEAVANIIVIANKMSEDLKDVEKEEMCNLVVETEQLLKECSVKYDQEQCSLLVDRVCELERLVSRGVVTRVVEDFMAADAPLLDLDLFADAESDEKKRKFILERKIAELLAQLGRVNRTARLLADTGNGGKHVSTQLKKCSEQTELLAPMLVKAAEERVNSPNDKAVIENYKALLAKYSESLTKVRDLCDQSVDPMDFVQTAGETMQRMRDESSKVNDPMQCAYTSNAITKLANRVIHVGMTSRSARGDPELARALHDARHRLAAATPAPDTRASRMPDWRDTTAEILRATVEVESVLGGENIFKKQPEPNQPIYNGALDLHVAIRDWSSRDNEIVAVAKRMAVLMAKLSDFMNRDKQRELLTTSKSIVTESHEVARLAKKLAHECTDIRIKNDLLKACERIPTISGQLKMLTTVKGSSLGHHGTHEDKEAMDMLVGNAQSLMLSIQDVIKGAASASVKIMSQKGPRMKWVRKNYY